MSSPSSRPCSRCMLAHQVPWLALLSPWEERPLSSLSKLPVMTNCRCILRRVLQHQQDPLSGRQAGSGVVSGLASTTPPPSARGCTHGPGPFRHCQPQPSPSQPMWLWRSESHEVQMSAWPAAVGASGPRWARGCSFRGHVGHACGTRQRAPGHHQSLRQPQLHRRGTVHRLWGRGCRSQHQQSLCLLIVSGIYQN